VYDANASGDSLYNYFRDYDPRIGRYAESDPIGLEGGPDTYVYVDASPLTLTDPMGQYIPGVHNSLSYTQAQGTCLGKKAVQLGQMTGDVDHALGSQLPQNASWHSMCPPGLSPQICRQQRDGYIRGNFGACTLDGLARALHATQDSFAPGHRKFQEWHGFPWSPGGETWGTAIMHFIGDIFPGSSAAARATRRIIIDWCSKCRSCSAN
jgi:RHS repeat-associated protein